MGGTETVEKEERNNEWWSIPINLRIVVLNLPNDAGTL